MPPPIVSPFPPNLKLDTDFVTVTDAERPDELVDIEYTLISKETVLRTRLLSECALVDVAWNNARGTSFSDPVITYYSTKPVATRLLFSRIDDGCDTSDATSNRSHLYAEILVKFSGGVSYIMRLMVCAIPRCSPYRHYDPLQMDYSEILLFRLVSAHCISGGTQKNVPILIYAPEKNGIFYIQYDNNRMRKLSWHTTRNDDPKYMSWGNMDPGESTHDKSVYTKLVIDGRTRAHLSIDIIDDEGTLIQVAFIAKCPPPSTEIMNTL